MGDWMRAGRCVGVRLRAPSTMHTLCTPCAVPHSHNSPSHQADYLARDAYHCGVKVSCDFDRLLAFSKVGACLRTRLEAGKAVFVPWLGCVGCMLGVAAGLCLALAASIYTCLHIETCHHTCYCTHRCAAMKFASSGVSITTSRSSSTRGRPCTGGCTRTGGRGSGLVCACQTHCVSQAGCRFAGGAPSPGINTPTHHGSHPLFTPTSSHSPSRPSSHLPSHQCSQEGQGPRIHGGGRTDGG